MSKESNIEAWIRVMNQGTILSNLNVKEFGKLLKLYPRFVATGMESLDKLRFRGITPLEAHHIQEENEEGGEEDDKEENDEEDDDDEEEEEKFQVDLRRTIIHLSRWLYKRCRGDQRDVCKSHHKYLKSYLCTTIEAAVKEAFRLFDANKHACAVSKLQKLLEKSEGPDCTKFEFAILILSAKYPNQVPYCSPELQNCITKELPKTVADEDKWGKEEYARNYALFQSNCDTLMDNIHKSEQKTTLQDVEKVAYVLDHWSVLKGIRTRSRTTPTLTTWTLKMTKGK
ncbi:hypothetical protein COL516b_008709 [Colletotrichum fioriniae]|nr:uncharacterized protein COL516b_008709 [Colletotrichum fioriniae]KAJ0299971.1 hypothetical protein COL516b_008709 [Colletotrichum fioriniae]